MKKTSFIFVLCGFLAVIPAQAESLEKPLAAALGQTQEKTSVTIVGAIPSSRRMVVKKAPRSSHSSLMISRPLKASEILMGKSKATPIRIMKLFEWRQRTMVVS